MCAYEYIPDYNDLHREYEAEQERRFEMRPRCCSCEKIISEDFYFLINDKIYCEDCLNDEFGRSTDDYMEDLLG